MRDFVVHSEHELGHISCVARKILTYKIALQTHFEHFGEQTCRAESLFPMSYSC